MKKFIKPVLAVLLFAVLGSVFGFKSPVFWTVLLAFIAFLAYLIYPAAMYYTGLIHYGKRRYDKAGKWFDRADKSGRLNPALRVNYAYYLLKAGEAARAEEILTECIQNKHLPFEILCQAKSNLSIVFSKTDRLSEGIGLIGEVYKEFKTTNVYGIYGYFLLLDKEYEKALEINKEAYAYNDSNAVIQDNLGLNYLYLGDLIEAEKLYDDLILKEPSFIEAYYDAALVKMRLGRVEEAKGLLEKALLLPVNFLSNVTHDEVKEELAKI